MKLLTRLQKIPRQKLIISVLIAAVAIGLIATLIWAYKTRRIRPFAAGNEIPNSATITWDGGSAVSNTVTTAIITAPAAPSGLVASATSSSVIHLAWADNSSDETGFKIERSLASGGPFAQAGTANANQITYDDQGLAANTTYYYRVASYNDAGNSGYSNTASATTQGGGQNMTVNLFLTLQGRTNLTSSGASLKIFSVGGTTPIFENNNVSTDSSGKGQIAVILAPGNYDFRLKVPNYLTALKSNVALTDQMTIDFGALKAGDLDNNDIINGLDFGRMNAKWFQADPNADLDQNGIVNGIDFSIMNSNWFAQGA